MFLSSRDLGDISKLLSGNALPQILFLITLPILAGIYDKESFGIFATFSALIAFTQPLSMLTLENALLTAKKEDISEIFFINLCMLVTFALVMSCIIYFALQVNFIEGFIFDLKYLTLIFIGIIIFGVARLSTVIANRETANTSIAKAAFFAGCIRVFFPLLAGVIFGSNPLFLIIGSLSGELTIFLILNNFFLKFFKNASNILKKINFKRFIFVLKENQNFVFQGSMASFMINSSAFVPAIVIGYIWGAEAVGIYFMADRIVGLPAQFMSAALNTYFIGSYSKNIREKINATNAIIRSLLIGLSLSIPFLVIVFFADQWLIILLGEDWSEVLNILNYVLIVAISKILVMPIATIPYILRKQIYELFGGLMRLLFLVSVFLFISIYGLDEITGIQMICIAIAGSYWVFFVIYIWLNKNYVKILSQN